MARRSKKGQERHDGAVRREANRLMKAGWNVQADIAGFDQPDPIGKEGRIPDIRATKSGAERLIEIETPDTIEKDKDQHATFRRRASHRPRSSFEIIETD
jgi:hypothetical protein